MLFGIDPVLPPDLLHTLAAMGHGDVLAIVDANFPATTMGRRVHLLPGLPSARVLDAVLSLLPLDDFIPEPCATMQVVGSADTVPPAVADLTAVLHRHGAKEARTVERFRFYEEAKTAFAIVRTGENRPYGNILLTKGIIVAPGSR